MQDTRLEDFDKVYGEFDELLKKIEARSRELNELKTARDDFGPAEQYRAKSISRAKDTTTQKNADAATFYKNILTIQNAADLQWPAAAPANVGVRGEFLLGIFPPDHGGNHAPTPTPAQQMPPKKQTIEREKCIMRRVPVELLAGESGKSRTHEHRLPRRHGRIALGGELTT